MNSLLTLPTGPTVSPPGINIHFVFIFRGNIICRQHVILALSRYNKDGSVGPQIVRVEDLPTKEETMAQQKETEQALEGDLVL